MVGAGLLAKKALERGLAVKPYVKTSMAPGSRVLTEYLQAAGLLEPLAELGFNIVGYGCTTCIGNSRPLPFEVVKAISEGDLVAASVLSGNRNFEGRINPHTRASFLASPPLVVAFALAGRADIDMLNEPLGIDRSGAPVFLREIWPSQAEVRSVIERSLSAEMFRRRYKDVFSGNQTWNEIPVSGGDLYEWSPDSTYIQEPPFFVDLGPDLPPHQDIREARVLAESFERIHRSNLVGMGVLPIEYLPGQGTEALGLIGDEQFDVLGLDESLTPGGTVQLQAS